MDTTSMELLKLHGSLNWRVQRGHLAPYTMDAIVHREPWLSLGGQSQQPGNGAIEDHLQPEPFMVPPILAKTDLGEKPILRLVWRKAFLALESAQQVVFRPIRFPRCAGMVSQHYRFIGIGESNSHRGTGQVFPPWQSRSRSDHNPQ